MLEKKCVHFGSLFPALIFILTFLSGCGGTDVATLPANTTATMAVLETTDMHTNVMSYDYFKLAEDKSLGFERVATLINNARAEFPNNVLLDNGDTIQGTALADYQALIKPVSCSETLAMYKVMNQFKYDGGGVGNHEFNYGLPSLNQVTGSHFDVEGVTNGATPCAGPNFPLVLANIYSVKSKAPLFAPYQIVTKTITATSPDGKTVTAPLKVGIIGFAPPAITAWDKRWLEGKIYTEGFVEAANKYIPEMRSKGAELVVALAHGGIDNSAYSQTMESPNWYLSQVAGIDALLMGHSHQLFPNATSTVGQFNLPGVDKVKGTVNGVPTVMANYWGKALGVIKLKLVYDGSKWTVDKTGTTVEARSIQNADKSYVVVDSVVAATIATEHIATIAYVKTPIGSTNFGMHSYFADVGDVSAIEVVNQAQASYVADYVNANLPQYKSLPVLSVSAPFKSGFAGGSDFTDVAQGNVAINNAADLYLYPNTVYAVRVQGSDIKNWLETAAKRFNRIDLAKATDQALVSTFPGYNFDMFSSPDIKYEIDVTQALNSRIKNLTYKGAAIDSAAYFIIATNNYRASGGGSVPGIDGSKTIYASPDANRDVLINYIKTTKALTLTNNGSDRSWSFTKVTPAGRVTFKSAPNKLSLAAAAGLTNISSLNNDDGSGRNLADYAIDLSR
ncbi:MAG: bifunctional 2',3'-cyclic-nucleotide 2'-phosphodiesterase/3'-nucleotidase [Polaromonas sp.]|uniref:bifunctional 2',3'-cyclic-nucleotide 2'-phosphodiesterase/3'-nucleotidase n=1 Tax=Polaromonas sp. TaxID=1869339 RepID=UPI0017955A00|nr:bifunctional 2',3'-cyclic-nucleotide 2'-phosphodiesterase/3'-nucleotidase [Polaromonas sp.]NMM09348.1 bifunctional 2',3'-cyclic-nucleotide 2'-phosphodiesterase/3'-nucleotidase [Polaromonas sp.]